MWWWWSGKKSITALTSKRVNVMDVSLCGCKHRYKTVKLQLLDSLELTPKPAVYCARLATLRRLSAIRLCCTVAMLMLHHLHGASFIPLQTVASCPSGEKDFLTHTSLKQVYDQEKQLRDRTLQHNNKIYISLRHASRLHFHLIYCRSPAA